MSIPSLVICTQVTIFFSYNGKTDVVSFVIELGRKLTIGVIYEINVRKWDREAVSVISSDYVGVFYWTPMAKVGIVNWQNVINILECKNKCLIFCDSFVFYKFQYIFCLIWVKENIGKMKGQFVSMVMPMVCWGMCSPNPNSTNMLSIRNSMLMVSSSA